MRKLLPLVLCCLAASLAAPWGGDAADTCPDAVVVAFADGTRLQITKWAFLYEWGERNDPPPREGFSYYQHTSRTRDLMVGIGKSVDRPGEFNAVREVACRDVAAILFSWQEASSLQSPDGISIKLTSGAVIRPDDLHPRTMARFVIAKKVGLAGQATWGDFYKSLRGR